MQLSSGVVALCLFAVCTGALVRNAATPVSKVVEMLQGMHSQGTEEKKAEQISFAAYKQWCDDTSIEKDSAIKEASSLMEQLEAKIGKLEADAQELARDIQGLDADIATWEADHKDATEIRQHENVDFVATHKDYSESIDALERAIQVLKSQAKPTPQAAAGLLQIVLKKTTIPDNARRVITAFLAQDPDATTGLDFEAPEAHAYEFQSGGVVDMLEKLLDKFIEERNQLEKEEANARHAYEMLAADLKNQVAQATKSRDDKAAIRGRKLQRSGDKKGELADTTAMHDADTQYLSDLKAQCETKNQEFESRQQLRTEELEAIEQAIDILQNHVTSRAQKYLPTLLQGKTAKAVKGTSFIQVRSLSQRSIQRTVASFLKDRGERLHSQVLISLATKVSEDPFAQVKKMIQDLVVRLMEEANSEAEHKGWCETELKTNEQTRKTKAAEVDSLTAEVDELTANINKLAQEVSDTNKELSELEQAMAKATDNRQKEKAQNEQTIADAKEAQTAVAQALTILKEFYSKSGEVPALIQTNQTQTPTEDSPVTWDKPYGGMQGVEKGVVGMLEVIQSDFARLETETSADEAQAKKDYNTMMTESQVNKAQMEKDIEYKTDKKNTLTGDKTEKMQDREGAQKELDASLQYYEKLKPACVDTSVSYEDRVARRKEEIESLQEALKILNGEDLAATAFIQQRSIRQHN